MFKFLVVLLSCAATSIAIAQDPFSVPSKPESSRAGVANPLKIETSQKSNPFAKNETSAKPEPSAENETSAEDELLKTLESDFTRLLKTANDPAAMLKAASLLNQTNDNTHWTNYSAATSVIRKSPEKSAIPLLLRYMIEHTRRSSRHVMIPEYEKTLALITGGKYKFDPASREFDEAAIRPRVQKFVDDWWAEEAWNESDTHSSDDLRVIVNALLEEVRKNGDFRGSGGRIGTAYRAYHNITYQIRQSGSSEYDRFKITKLYDGMVPLVLEPFGYDAGLASEKFGSSKKSKPADNATVSLDPFPYETIMILAELAKNGYRNDVAAIGDDKRQNSTVRIACVLSMFRAGEELRSAPLIEVLNSEKEIQRRLIILCALRWAGESATDVLVKNLDDPNLEIATAAACSLVETQPSEALPKLKHLFDRDRLGTTSLAWSSLGNWSTNDAKTFLEDQLVDALEKKNDKHLDNVFSAFLSANDISSPSWVSKDHNLRSTARIVLNHYREKRALLKVEQQRLVALVESAAIQLNVAQEIETIRKAEYKRLLALQAEEIVTAEESQTAHHDLNEIRSEVKQLREKVQSIEAQLESRHPANR